MLALALCAGGCRRAAALGRTGRGHGSAGGRPAPPERRACRAPRRHPRAGSRGRAGRSGALCRAGAGGAQQVARRADDPAGSGRGARTTVTAGWSRTSSAATVCGCRARCSSRGSPRCRRGRARRRARQRCWRWNRARARLGAGYGRRRHSCRRTRARSGDSTGRFRIVRGTGAAGRADRELRLSELRRRLARRLHRARAPHRARGRRSRASTSRGSRDGSSRCAASCSRRAAP